MHTEPSAAAPPPLIPQPDRRRADYWLLGTAGGLVLGLALLLSLPWLPTRHAAYTLRERYLPRYHGQATLYVELDAAGEPQIWTAENVTRLPILSALTGALPDPIYETLLAAWPEINEQGRLPRGAALYRIHTQTYTPDTPSAWLDHYLLRTITGDYLLGFSDPNTGVALAYTPPLRQVLPDLTPSSRWAQSGKLDGTYTYTATGTILESTASLPATVQRAARFPSAQAAPGCLLLQLQTSIDFQPNAPLHETITSWICPELGPTVIHLTGSNSDTSQIRLRLDAGTNRTRSSKTPLYNRNDIAPWMPPPTPLTSTSSHLPPLHTWTLQYMGQDPAMGSLRQSTMAPRYVPAPQPYVLTGNRSGSVVALDAQEPENVRWRFRTGGAVYGRPTLGQESGTIFLGSSDKRLYALNHAGLYLWQAVTHDNVAAPPIFWNNRVITVSEDGSIYAFDAHHGARIWKTPLDAGSVAGPLIHPAASSPSNMDRRIIAATDAGSVYALDPSTGAVLWQTELDDAITASPRAAGDTLFIATRTGAVIALAPSEGTVLWRAMLNGNATMSPVLDEKNLYIIDQAGWLHAIRRRNGQVQWRSHSYWYVGSPILVQSQTDPLTTDTLTDTLVVAATANGNIVALDGGGAILHDWTLQASGADASPALTFGPTVGGSAIWIADDQSRLYRLGSSLP